MKLVYFRDNSGVHIIESFNNRFWDNPKEAVNLHRGDEILLTYTRSRLFKTDEEWMESECMVATYTGDCVALQVREGFWDGHPGGLLYRHYFTNPRMIKVRDIEGETLAHLMRLKTGSVIYHPN